MKLHLCKCNKRSCHPTAGTLFFPVGVGKPRHVERERERESDGVKNEWKETRESFNVGTVGPEAFPSSLWLALKELNSTAYRSFHMHDRGLPKPPSHWQRKWDSAHPEAISENCQMIFCSLSREVVQCSAVLLSWYLPAWTEWASRDVLARPAREEGSGGKVRRGRRWCRGHGGLLVEPCCQACLVVCVIASRL